MKIEELGPFPGMTFAGRQKIEAAITQGSGLARTAVLRLVDRQKDVMTPETVVLPSDEAFSDRWNARRTGFLLTALVLVFTWLAAGYISILDLNFRVRTPEYDFAFFLGLAIFTVIFGGPMSALGWVFLTVIRNGFFSADGMRSISEQTWVIGVNALYVTDREPYGNKIVAKTVFYDAIGTVDVEEQRSGRNSVVVRSRDGSEIASFTSPSTADGGGAQAVADAIHEHIAQ